MPNAGRILIADDDSDYAVLLQVALNHAGIYNPVQIVANGDEVVQYLKGEGAYADREVHSLPRLLMMDVRLPLRRGFDVLRWIRRQPGLRGLVIVMLSGSDYENEAQIAKDLGANTFLVKPIRFEELVETLKQKWEVWFGRTKPLRATAKAVANNALLVGASKQPRARVPVAYDNYRSDGLLLPTGHAGVFDEFVASGTLHQSRA